MSILINQPIISSSLFFSTSLKKKIKDIETCTYTFPIICDNSIKSVKYLEQSCVARN